MKQFPCQPKVTQEEAMEHIANARQLVYDAISEINQSLRASELSRELNQLYRIEDILWQYATANKGGRANVRSASRRQLR